MLEMPSRAEAQRNKIEFVRSLWEAADAGGLEAALALTDPEAEWAPHPAGGRVLSTAELLSFLEQYRGERELLRATPYAISAHGDRVLASGSFRLHGPDGRISEIQIHWVSEFEDGRFVRARSYPSEAEALAAIESRA
jgi:ketosteroid isomerase-like protein